MSALGVLLLLMAIRSSTSPHHFPPNLFKWKTLFALNIALELDFLAIVENFSQFLCFSVMKSIGGVLGGRYILNIFLLTLLLIFIYISSSIFFLIVGMENR